MLATSMAGLWLLGSLAAGVLTVFEVNERLDDAIEEVAQRLLPATYDAVQQPQAMHQMARHLVATMDPKALAYKIIGPAGEIVMSSENAPENPFPGPRQAGALTVEPLLFFLPLSWFLIRWSVFRGTRSLDRLRSESGRRDGSNLS